ncbi:MAG: class I adenylate cyclase, partial [Gammaproteobacteria bacterium]|nr:class I adenylate cyclase [Gammaproteobacteria bacterium]
MAQSLYHRDGIGRKDLEQIRRRFTLIQRERLRRIEMELLPTQQSFIELLPLLFHINHPMLPGFVNTQTPAGIPGFVPGKRLLQIAKSISRSFEYKKRARRRYNIQGLYLMGSIGSVAHTAGSDFDVWLCHDPALRPYAVEGLRSKATRIEAWAKSLALEVHIFVMNVETFRQGERESLSHESSGTTQRRLLLEEFYRTGVLLAGRYPLWWLVPPEEEANYQAYADTLLHKRFVDPLDCIDFGGLETVSPDEFFGAAHWQLFKGIESPYKTILKLLLTEAYSQEYPDVRWLCQEAKRAIYEGEENPDELDPYVLLYRRLEQYLTSRRERQRLELARRCFYFKSGQKLSRCRNQPELRWQQKLIQRLTEEWHWRPQEIELLDAREQWKIDRVLEERNTLVRELNHSFRLLTDFARAYADQSSIDPEELSLLGRKLYTAMERRPGKIDSINPGISRNLQEERLSLHYVAGREGSAPAWYLYLGEVSSTQARVSTPMKSAPGLIELLTWCHLNGIIRYATRVTRHPADCPVAEGELRSLLAALNSIYPDGIAGDVPIDQLAEQPYALACTLFVNIGKDPMDRLSKLGKQLTSDRSDPLSFGSAHASLVAGIEQLVTTSWGETLVYTHQREPGLLNALLLYLRLLKRRPAELTSIPQITAHSFSSVRASGIARRLETLFNAVAEAFSGNDDGCRYLLQLGDELHLIEEQGGEFTATPIGGEVELDQLLSQPRTGFAPLVIDPMALRDTPLPAIYAENQRNAIQLFYYNRRTTTELYLLDEQGALFQQRLPSTDEHFLLMQQQRFLNDILLTRNLQARNPAHRLLLDAPKFYLLDRDREGRYTAQAKAAPRHRLSDDYLELRLICDSIDLARTPHFLVCGEREFSSVEYGARLYAA